MSNTYHPPHQPTDKAKLAAMVETYRSGGTLPAVAGQGEIAITGSHRIAAYNAARRAWANQDAGWENSPEPNLEMIEIDDAEYRQALDNLGYDDAGEGWNEFCAELANITESDELRAALADQQG